MNADPQYANLGSINLKGDPTKQVNYKIETLVLGITHGFAVERCAENAKFAVVEVEFEDGTIWKPNGNSLLLNPS